MKRFALIALAIAIVLSISAFSAYANTGKSWVTINAQNDADIEWSDFHISLFPVEQPFGAIFIDSSTGGFDPVYLLNGIQKPVSWTINNSNPTGPSIDLYFTDYVWPNDFATFKVYVDNSATMKKFGWSFYPTSDHRAIPEWSSMWLALSGGLGVIGYVRRRK